MRLRANSFGALEKPIECFIPKGREVVVGVAATVRLLERQGRYFLREETYLCGETDSRIDLGCVAFVYLAAN